MRAARAVSTASDDAVARATVHRDFVRAWVSRGMRPQIELDYIERLLKDF